MAERDLSTEREIEVRPSELDDLLARSRQRETPAAHRESVGVGELLALMDNGRTAIVTINQDGDAARSRTTIDLHADHIGQQVVLLFEDGDRDRPIVVGVVRAERSMVPSELTGHVDVAADGERMVVSARRELVLQCGKASITLQQDGTVRIVGERILSRATGPNRVQGGSIQLN